VYEDAFERRRERGGRARWKQESTRASRGRAAAAAAATVALAQKLILRKMKEKTEVQYNAGDTEDARKEVKWWNETVTLEFIFLSKSLASLENELQS